MVRMDDVKDLKSEKITLSCRVNGAWYERVN